MTADEPVAGVPRLCARRADCARPRGHDDECGPDRADTELADLRAEVEYLQESGRRMMAERDALQRQVDAARDLGQEWRRLSGLGEPLSMHALAAASPAMRTLSEAASDLLSVLEAVEPADQPHPTPEADEACDVVPGKAHSLWCVTHDREPLDVWGCADEAGS